MKVSFLGIQGSGKGTQAELLSKEFDVIKVVAGDLLREEKKKESELGKEISKFMDKGELVPVKIIHDLIKEKIKGKEKYVIDGFPRNMEQVEISKDIEFDKVIHILLPDQIVLDRLQGRLTCSKCGAVYHVKYNKPKVEDKCDNCGGELYVREDEKGEVIKQRINAFKKETLPVVEYFREKKILFEINGNRTIKEIYEDIRKLFK